MVKGLSLTQLKEVFLKTLPVKINTSKHRDKARPWAGELTYAAPTDEVISACWAMVLNCQAPRIPNKIKSELEEKNEILTIANYGDAPDPWWILCLFGLLLYRVSKKSFPLSALVDNIEFHRKTGMTGTTLDDIVKKVDPEHDKPPPEFAVQVWRLYEQFRDKPQ